MTRIGVLVGIAAACAAIAMSFVPAPSPARAGSAAAQAAPALLIDKCIEVSAGEQFEVDIKVRGVSNLLAWEVYFAYNLNYIEVVNKDVHQMLATGRAPVVYDFSDPVPNSTGFYRMGAADVGSGDGPKQGDVLVHLTLRAKREGITPANIHRGDYNSDGTIDFGPTLTGPGPTYLGDTNGDQLFDGEISSGQIAIDTSCVQPPPVLQPGESEGVPPDPPSEAQGENSDSGPEPVANTQDGSSDGDGGTGTGGGGDSESSSNTTEESQNTEGEGPEGAVLDEGSNENGERGGLDGNRRNTADSGGFAGGLFPWVLIGVGVAVAASGGITFYIIRAASREPY